MSLIVLTAVGPEPYARMLPKELDASIVDVRDHGAFTFDSFAHDLDRRRAALGAERIAILGHSILGMLAIEYGRRFPKRVSLAILAGTPPNGDMQALNARSLEFFEREASEERKRIHHQDPLSQTAMRFFDPRTDAAALYEGATFDRPFFEHLLGTVAPSWDITRDAASLTFPILIAHGRYDFVVPYEMWNGIPERLPDATFRLFPRSAHHPFYEEPEAFVAAIKEPTSAMQARPPFADSGEP